MNTPKNDNGAAVVLDAIVRKFRRGQRVSVEFQDGEPDENWTGIGKFVRYVNTDDPGLHHLTEPHAIIKTSEDDWGSVFPVRCIISPRGSVLGCDCYGHLETLAEWSEVKEPRGI